MGKATASKWYHHLALLKPAPYKPWRHALRIAIGTGLPLFIGVLAGDVRAVFFVALGAFLTAFTVRLDQYRERFLQIAISTSIGVLGCFIGPLVAGHGLMTIFMLAFVGLFSGLISGYGAAFSTGALNMLVLAIVTSTMPHEIAPWILGLQYLMGALFVLLMLGVGAVLDSSRPERHMMAGLLEAVSDLARVTATAPKSPSTDGRISLEQQRRIVTDASAAAYNSLIEKRSHGRARTRDSQHVAAVLSVINQLTMSIIAAHESSDNLLVTADRLAAMATAYSEGSMPFAEAKAADKQPGELLRLVDKLEAELWSAPQRSAETHGSRHKLAIPVFSRKPLNALGRRLILGREIITSALRLSLCMFIAVLVSEFLNEDHAYWLPMTVAIVLKPDFGSVFVRAIHRSLGTLIGVGLAAVIGAFVHGNLGIVAVITALCAFIPWAGLRSYAATVAFMTPVILLMISLVVPGSADSFAEQRTIDTLIGVAIALIFGYLIWPRSQAVQLGMAFSSALDSVSKFLSAAIASVPKEEPGLGNFRQALSDTEFAAYRGLSDLRTQLQRYVAEPPPAGREAAAWFPAVAGAERLCDRIVTYAERRHMGDPPLDENRASWALEAIEELASTQARSDNIQPLAGGREEGDLFTEVEDEIAWLLVYRNQLRAENGGARINFTSGSYR